MVWGRIISSLLSLMNWGTQNIEIQLVDTIVNPAFSDGKYVFAKKDDKDVISFVDVVLGLSREKYIDLYATGSNSKMLSSDIVTEFKDKTTNISLLIMV